MCELLALAGVPRAAGAAWLDAFHRRGGDLGPHGDGWGVVTLSGGGGGGPPPEVAVYREAAPASASRFAGVVRGRVRGGGAASGDVLLGHIRKATRGARALRNTQPFVRELGGRVHVFAHNGDLPGAEEAFPLEGCGPCRPVGETDSERLFCALMRALGDLWCAVEPGEVPPLGARLVAIEAVAARARALGPANFFYWDGDVLFAHAHERTQPSGQVEAPGLLLRRLVGGVLLASVPFTLDGEREAEHGGRWEPLGSGALLVIRAGRVVVEDEGAR